MLTPNDIRKKALRHYPTFLAAVLRRERFFPLEIKGNKGRANAPMDELVPALRRLLESEKKQLGYGYSVLLKSVNTRHAGTISMPDQILFENVEDYLKYIDKESEFLAFRNAAMQTRKEVPVLQNWMSENPQKVLKNLQNWSFLLQISAFLLKNPRFGQFSRALPIHIPATFVEQHQAILAELLEAILPPEAIDFSTTIFEKRFGFLRDEPLVRVRFLDKNNSPFAEKTDNIALPISAWQQDEISAKNVYFILDKINFLRFPRRADSVAIFLTKAMLKELESLSFLNEKSIYFWGDLSVLHLQILSLLRQQFSGVQSLFIEQKILEKYQLFIETVKPSKIERITHLQAEEEAVLAVLLEGKRLIAGHILQGELVVNEAY